MKWRTIAPLVALVAVTACGRARYVVVPPAVDLAAFDSVGLIVFKAEGAKGDLDAVATQYFLQEVMAAQRVPVVEFGPVDGLLADIGRPGLDRDAALAIGQKSDVGAFFAGEIKVTKVKPRIDLAAPLSKSLFARAAFDITVTARLVSTANGATLWTQSITRQGTVGSVGMDGGVPVFAVRDQSAAMSEVLREISFQMTWDFRPTRRRL